MTEQQTLAAEGTGGGWKFLDQGGDGMLWSRSGSHAWQLGTWYHQGGRIVRCTQGFHCSPTIERAFSYVGSPVLAQVEAKGKFDADDDKTAWSDMRITRAWRLTEVDLVEVAVYAAELVIDIFEQRFPGDDRPRKSIEAARAWLSAGNQTADAAAYAAAAYAAAAAAASAASAAYAAAYAARGAAYAASAASAAYAGYAAARAAAAAEIRRKINEWFSSRLDQFDQIR